MNIQQILDYPIWSKVVLNNTGLARFFSVPGPSADSGIDAALQIDKSALFTMHMLESEFNADRRCANYGSKSGNYRTSH